MRRVDRLLLKIQQAERLDALQLAVALIGKRAESGKCEDNIAESPAAPALYLVFQPVEEKPQAHEARNFLRGKRNILRGDRNILRGKRNILRGRKFFHEATKPQ